MKRAVTALLVAATFLLTGCQTTVGEQRNQVYERCIAKQWYSHQKHLEPSAFCEMVSQKLVNGIND